MQAIPLAQISFLGLTILGILALLSIFAATIVIAKLVQFARAQVGRGQPVQAALAHWQAGQGQEALQHLRQARGMRARVVYGALSVLAAAPHAAEQAQVQATHLASDGLDQLTRHMRGLEAVVQAAPMLGLLGTVVGMIEAFGKLAASSGAADPAQLASGIWTALITTAVGLGIAILFYLVALWLEGRIAAERHALEQIIAQIGMFAPVTPHPAAAAGYSPGAHPNAHHGLNPSMGGGASAGSGYGAGLRPPATAPGNHGLASAAPQGSAQGAGHVSVHGPAPVRAANPATRPATGYAPMHATAPSTAPTTGPMSMPARAAQPLPGVAAQATWPVQGQPGGKPASDQGADGRGFPGAAAQPGPQSPFGGPVPEGMRPKR